MSFPTSSDPPPAGAPKPKARPDVYTVMLAVSLVAILLGILCLYLENKAYNFEFKGGPPPAASLELDASPGHSLWA